MHENDVNVGNVNSCNLRTEEKNISNKYHQILLVFSLLFYDISFNVIASSNRIFLFFFIIVVDSIG